MPSPALTAVDAGDRGRRSGPNGRRGAHPAARLGTLLAGHECQRKAPARWPATLLRGGVLRVRTRSHATTLRQARTRVIAWVPDPRSAVTVTAIHPVIPTARRAPAPPDQTTYAGFEVLDITTRTHGPRPRLVVLEL